VSALAKAPAQTDQSPLRSRSTADLTRALLGRSLNHSQLERVLARVELATGDHPDRPTSLWVGSIGYENFRDVADFARHLRRAGVERLVDVRELPISRRSGYAKTALGDALSAEGIEYIHLKGLGNPKPIRDLYKSGAIERASALYRDHLTHEQCSQLDELVPLLQEKRSALMCVEHDQHVCHRDVIIEALQSELDLKLDVAALA
jgi:hypothetical protein